MSKYEMTIGIECHVQLATKTKLFSVSDNDARDKEPNSVVSAIDYGLPGMLPVLNEAAIDLAIRAGLALNADIAKVSRFDRKHYFYPDLPKGYQTTQMYQPIILGGHVDAPLEDGSVVSVRIHHAHLEEDAGKLIHKSDKSMVDLNRAGTPLIEIVSEPDMHSPKEARAYAMELYRLMTFANVTHGDLYHGNMRFDVNISVAEKHADTLGARAEVKNLNSFRSIEKAAEYEFKRQVELLESGLSVPQETRGWDEVKQVTNSQRSKEDAQDYRYMPDADIPPIEITDSEVQAVKDIMPMLPAAYRQAWRDLGVDTSVINALLANQTYAIAITSLLDSGSEHARRGANWIASVLVADAISTGNGSESEVINIRGIAALSKMVSANELSSTSAKEIFLAIVHDMKSDPRNVAEEKGLLQMSDTDSVRAVVEEVLADETSAKAVEDVKNGNDKAIGYLVGQVMQRSKGKANPSMAQALIREQL